MKIAVIGSGAFGINHVKTLHQLGALGPVVEPNTDRHPAILQHVPDAELLTDAAALGQRADVPAAVIATPAHTHHSVAKNLLLAGLDVLVEKPMTLSAADAEDLDQIARAHQRVLMVGHLLLYTPAIRFIRDFLAEGRLGRVFTLHQQRAKLGRVRANEDVLWSLGVHDVAVLLHLVGAAPDRVSAFGHKGLQPTIADDTCLHLDFPGGIKATLHNSWLWPEDSRRLRIIGQNGMLDYDEKKQTVTLHEKTVGSDLNHHDGPSTILFTGSEPPLPLELRHFIDCVQTRSTPLSDARNGIDVIKVLESASAQY